MIPRAFDMYILGVSLAVGVVGCATIHCIGPLSFSEKSIKGHYRLQMICVHFVIVFCYS